MIDWKKLNEQLQEPPTDQEELKARVIEMLRTIYDPEIPVNIYDLGLIYELDVQAYRRGACPHDTDRPQLSGGGEFSGYGADQAVAGGRRQRCDGGTGVGAALGSREHVGGCTLAARYVVKKRGR